MTRPARTGALPHSLLVRKLCDGGKVPMNGQTAAATANECRGRLRYRPGEGRRRIEPMQQQGKQQGQGGAGGNHPTSTPGATRTLSLMKGNQQFCFRYQVGEESKVLEALVE